MRVLLTTDGSNESKDAIRTASRLLARQDRETDVLYVAPETARSGQRDRIAQHTKRILQEAKRVLAEEGIAASAVCRSGSPARVILREASNYDITVAGAQGQGEHALGGLGYVASRLVEHASGCVLIGRTPPRDRQARILVPVDGSDGSNQALDMLASFFDLESADVTLLHVLETPWLPEDENDEPQEGADQVKLELRSEAEALLSQARAKILPMHSGVTTLVREGIPANEILSASDQGDYDLIVVGATDATDMKHQVLGSVASKAAWNAPCSVLLVRVPE
jgi:nucleotide-binding universal stress UspA family protein